MSKALAQDDALGIGDKAPKIAQPVEDKAKAFRRWLTERVMTDVIGHDGGWLEPHLRQASNRALKRAGRLAATSHVRRPPALTDFDPSEPRDPYGKWTDEGIEAFHGSAQDFDRFEESKIGSGQGAETYGHGLYFAEEPKVAEDYREQIAGAQPFPGLQKHGNLLPRETLAPDLAQDYMLVAPSGHTIAQAKTWFQNRIDQEKRALPGYKEGTLGYVTAKKRLDKHKDILAAVNRLEAGGYELGKSPAGVLYTVRIHARDEQMLDWDKPLNEQSAYVRRAVAGLVKKDKPWLDESTIPNAKGEDIYWIPGHKDKVENARDLQAAGIKGIKYLDEKSRYGLQLQAELDELERSRDRAIRMPVTPPSSIGGYSAGMPNYQEMELATIDAQMRSLRKRIAETPHTHNFVVFDPDDVEITAKNGVQTRATATAADAEPNSGERERFKRAWLEASLKALPAPKLSSSTRTLDACQAVSVGALCDICSDVVDDATNSVHARLLMLRPRPGDMRKAVMAAMGRGASRTKTLVEHAMSQAYAQSTLDAFEEMGFTHVGTLSEHRLRDAYFTDPQFVELLDDWAVLGQDVIPKDELTRHDRGMDCWCHPRNDGGVVVHNVSEAKDFDPDEPRDPEGKWTAGEGYDETKLPPAPGTAPIPEGAVRLYHQTSEEAAKSIAREGLSYSHALGIEGPKAIYADEHGFYGDPGKFPQGLSTVEFWVPKAQWDKPFVNWDVPPSQIVGVHLPWHEHVRYAAEEPRSREAILRGEFDHMENDPEYGRAIRYVKAHYGPKPDGITVYHGSPFDFKQFDLEHMEQGEGAAGAGYGGVPANDYGYGVYTAEAPETAQSYRESVGARAGVKGNLYQATIHGTPDEFVDWDKPLEEQPKLVRDYAANTTVPPGTSGAHLMTGWLGVGPKSSARMRAAGIKGVRYLDNYSRSVGHGTHNYVVFDPRDIEITHKNGAALHDWTPTGVADFDPSEPRDPAGRWTKSEEIVAYHGSREEIGQWSKIGEPRENFNAAAQLGHHFAKDPEIANAFTEERYNYGSRRMQEGGRIQAVKLPPERMFLTVPQPPYAYVKPGDPITNHNIETDDTAVMKMIGRKAYPAHPDILARYLVQARALDPDDARNRAKIMAAGGRAPFPGEGPNSDGFLSLDQLVDNYVGALPYDKADKLALIRTARKRWQDEGYVGLKYVDTSPMETDPAYGVKDNTAYIVFDPKHVTGLYTGDFDPDEPRDPAGKWTTAPGGLAGPYLIPTVQWKGKRYYPPMGKEPEMTAFSHASIVRANPALQTMLSEANWGGDSDRVLMYTTPEGKLLNRYEAMEYAKQTGIMDPSGYGANQRDLISEALRVEATDPAHLLFRRQPGEHGMTAVSPSTHDIDLATAVASLTGEKQKKFLDASKEIDEGLGLAAKDVSVVGAWKDGAENAVATITDNADWDRLTASAAMKAHLSNQKAALVFQQEADGDSALYRFHATGDVAAIHAGLLEDGVANHSIAPDEDGKGATIYVVDLDGSAYHGVAKSAERFNAKVTYQIGHAAFLGSSAEGDDARQRADARTAYEGVIGQSKVPAVADLWARVHARWGQAFQDGLTDWIAWFDIDDAARKNPQGRHPRTGQFATATVVARETRRHKKTGRFQKQGATEETQARAERAERQFNRIKGRVDVLTAGDDRVCDVCDGISANGPYTIARARSLIPAHPNCRCVFVTADRSARDAEPATYVGRYGYPYEEHVYV